MAITGTRTHATAPLPAGESFIAFPLVAAMAGDTAQVTESDVGHDLPDRGLRGCDRWWAAR
ncbi:hypothetical protein [Micromonospora sp. NPDC048887]|uniref:hypothetical protein n=1 Tax=unclassified Micromonospora TaxID=2617518 RepID=UPI0033CAF392